MKTNYAKTKAELDSAFTTGATAYDEGEMITANPFNAEAAFEFTAWEQWRAGWRAAHRMFCESITNSVPKQYWSKK